MKHLHMHCITLSAVILLAACQKGSEEPKPTPPAPPPATTPAPTTAAEPAPAKRVTPQPAVTQTAPVSQTAPAGVATPGTTLRETELMDKPFLDARPLRKLPANTAVAILERQGGWMRVNAAGQEGWLRLLHVRSGTASGSGTDVKAVTALATGRAGTGNIVATSGIRGLNEEQLRTAQGNAEQLARMESYAASKQAAAQYAANNGLKASNLAYLPAPGAK